MSTSALRSSFLSLVGLCLLGAPDVQAQTGEDIIRFGHRDAGVSARTLGLAGASGGGIGDWGSAAVNPAAIGLARLSHITGSLDGTTTRAEAGTGAPTTARTTRLSPGHAAYVHVMPAARGALVAGLGLHRTSSLDRRLFFEEPGSEGRWAQFYESGWLGELSGVVSIEAMPRLFVGASLNAVFGSYSFAEYVGTGGVTQDTWFLDAEIGGINARAGVVGEPAPGLRLGLAIESPTWLQIEESFGRDFAGPWEAEYAMQLPWRVTAGGVYQSDRILLSADLVFSDWTSATLRPADRFAQERDEIRRTFRETIDARVGAEYDFGLGAVRAGYALTQDPLRDEVETDRLRHTFASGVSFYAWRGVTIDLGVAYTEFRDQVYVPHHDLVVTESVGRLRGMVGLQYNL